MARLPLNLRVFERVRACQTFKHRISLEGLHCRSYILSTHTALIADTPWSGNSEGIRLKNFSKSFHSSFSTVPVKYIDGKSNCTANMHNGGYKNKISFNHTVKKANCFTN